MNYPQREIYLYPVCIIAVMTLHLTQNRVLQSTRVIKNIRMGNTAHYHIAVNTAAPYFLEIYLLKGQFIIYTLKP